MGFGSGGSKFGSGAGDLDGSLTVDGKISGSSGASIDGGITLSNNINMSGTLLVQKATFVSGALNVTGAIAAGGLTLTRANVTNGDIISAALGANGSVCALRVLEKSITCSTSDATTEDSNFFPAHSVPVAISIRVTTAITNNAFIKKVGHTNNANQFAGSSDGSQDFGDGEIEAADSTSVTGGGGNITFHQATDLVITHNATPGAGVVRVAYYYYQITPPTS